MLPSLQAYAYVANEDSIINHNASRYATRDVVEPATGTSVQGSDERGDYVDETTVKYHKVRKGENLTSIARRYGTTVGAIRRNNGMGRKSGVRRGQSLKIITTTRRYVPKAESAETCRQVEPESPDTLSVSPAASEAATADSALTRQAEEVVRVITAPEKAKAEPKPKAAAKPKKRTSRQASATIYTVRSGDNLYNIGRRHGVTSDAIMKANGMKNDRLQPGQKLKIPAKK